MIILVEVYRNELVNRLVLNLLEVSHHLAERYIVNVVSETDLSLNLVTVSNGYIVHLVSETDDSHVLRVSPTSCNSLPYCDALESLRILPVAYNGLAALAQA